MSPDKPSKRGKEKATKTRLTNLRRTIDATDRQIIELLARRLKTGYDVLEAKRKEGGTPYDPARERDVWARLRKLAGDRIPRASLDAIYREIISATRTLQFQTPIAYLGSEGSLTHYAAARRFGSSAPFVPVRRPKELFEWVASERGHYAVFTMEGGSEQSSLDSVDRFLETKLGIFGEFYVEDSHGLFARPDSRSIKKVYAHPTALAACSRWVESQAGRVEIIATTTYLEAGRQAARAKGRAALGNSLLETLAGLARLEDLLDDDASRLRRFLILSEDRLPRSERDKTSFLVVIPNAPGGMNRVTEILARRKINLCWIRPYATRLGTWDHIFWLEVEGHPDDRGVRDALSELKGAMEFLKVIGSYPLERPPRRPF